MIIHSDIHKIEIMNKFLVFLACAMFAMAFVHVARADDDNAKSEYGTESCMTFLYV